MEEANQPTNGKDTQRAAFDRRRAQGKMTADEHQKQTARLRQRGKGARFRGRERGKVKLALRKGRITEAEAAQMLPLIERNMRCSEALTIVRRTEWHPGDPK